MDSGEGDLSHYPYKQRETGGQGERGPAVREVGMQPVSSCPAVSEESAVTKTPGSEYKGPFYVARS